MVAVDASGIAAQSLVPRAMCCSPRSGMLLSTRWLVWQWCHIQCSSQRRNQRRSQRQQSVPRTVRLTWPLNSKVVPSWAPSRMPNTLRSSFNFCARHLLFGKHRSEQRHGGMCESMQARTCKYVPIHMCIKIPVFLPKWPRSNTCVRLCLRAV